VAQVPALSRDEHWLLELESLRVEYKDVIRQHPEARDAVERVHKFLNDIVCLARCTI